MRRNATLRPLASSLAGPNGVRNHAAQKFFGGRNASIIAASLASRRLKERAHKADWTGCRQMTESEVIRGPMRGNASNAATSPTNPTANRSARTTGAIRPANFAENCAHSARDQREREPAQISRAPPPAVRVATGGERPERQSLLLEMTEHAG